jgi:hypothetical protein
VVFIGFGNCFALPSPCLFTFGGGADELKEFAKKAQAPSQFVHYTKFVADSGFAS